MRVSREFLQICALCGRDRVWGLNDNKEPRGRVPGGDAKTQGQLWLSMFKGCQARWGWLGG